MRIPRFLLICVISLGAVTACDSPADFGLERPSDPYSLPSMDGEAINVIVEVPAGTNRKIEFHPEEGFRPDKSTNGADRIINFLPYPGNYGFVPSTLMDRDRGGDGDPLDVLVLSESLKTGSLVPVRPIGALLLRDGGEIDTKIIGVPVDSSLQVFRIDNYLDFALRQDAARSIIETWFLNYKGAGETELLRWEDEQYALREIEKWRTD